MHGDVSGAGATLDLAYCPTILPEPLTALSLLVVVNDKQKFKHATKTEGSTPLAKLEARHRTLASAGIPLFSVPPPSKMFHQAHS